MSARKKKQPIRGYALTPWSKALLDRKRRTRSR